MDGEVSFAESSLAMLRPWLGPANRADLPLDASADGKLLFSGNALDPASWSGRAEMPPYGSVPTLDAKVQSIALQNIGPVVLAVSRKEIVIKSARFTGTDTNLEVSGKLGLGTATSAFDVRLRGGVNLAILNGFYPEPEGVG